MYSLLFWLFISNAMYCVALLIDSNDPFFRFGFSNSSIKASVWQKQIRDELDIPACLSSWFSLLDALIELVEIPQVS